MLNMEGMKQLKEIENKFKSNGYDAETKKDIEFLLTCYNSLNWDIDSLKEKLEELKPYQFINEICNVCKDYGYSISHQDTQGAFVIKNMMKYILIGLKMQILILDRRMNRWKILQLLDLWEVF